MKIHKLKKSKLGDSIIRFRFRAPAVQRAFMGIILLLFSSFSVERLSALVPPNPGGGYNIELDSWSFSLTNWRSDAGYAPVAFTNIAIVTNGGDGNCLLLDTTNTSPAYLFYNVVETDGTTNLICSNGSIYLWFNPCWASTNQGGTGPGNYGNLISLGQAGTNGPWWSWYLSPDGCTVYFSSQTNGGSATNYFAAPVSFAASNWYNLVLTYGPTNTAFYTNGVQVTNGPGVVYWPGPDVTFFAIGSDTNGFYQAGAMFDDVQTYNYPLDPSFIGSAYALYTIFYYGPGDMPILNSAPFTNTTSPNYVAVTGAGYLTSLGTNSSGCVTSSNIWITNMTATLLTNSTVSVTFGIAGGSNNVLYDVFATTALTSPITNGVWAWLGQGYHCTTYTITNLPNTTVLFILGQPQDSDGDGLTDAYELLVSHTDPHNPDSNGSGMLDGWKVDFGLNPLINPTTQSNLLSNFTYDPVGRLDLVTGIRAEGITNDFEGNVLVAH